MTRNPIFPFDAELLDRLLGLAQTGTAAADLPEGDSRAAFAARQANMDLATAALRASAEAGQAAFARLLSAAGDALADKANGAAESGALDDLADQIKAANSAAWSDALTTITGQKAGGPSR